MSENPNYTSLVQIAEAGGFREKPLAIAVRGAVEALASYFGRWNEIDPVLWKALQVTKEGAAGVLGQIADENTVAANDSFNSDSIKEAA